VPKPTTTPTISGKKLATITGLSEERQRQLAKAGHYPAPVRGQYETISTLTGLFAYFRELAHRRNDQLKKEQEKLTRTKRERAEEELAVFRGQYVAVAELGPSLRNFSLQQRAILQRKLEIELGPKLPGMTYPELQPILAATVDEICKIFEEGCQLWTAQPPANS
jgi:hypothetical protein